MSENGSVSLPFEPPEQENIRLREENAAILKDPIPKAQVRVTLMAGARLAALAIAHGAVLLANLRDFARFPGLK